MTDPEETVAAAPEVPVIVYMQHGARGESPYRYADLRPGEDLLILAYSVAGDMIEAGTAAPLGVRVGETMHTMDDLEQRYGPWWKNL